MRPRSVWESVRSEGEEVRRIVSNIAAGDIEAAKCFYHDMLGLDVMMDPWLDRDLRIARADDGSEARRGKHPGSSEAVARDRARTGGDRRAGVRVDTRNFANLAARLRESLGLRARPSAAAIDHVRIHLMRLLRLHERAGVREQKHGRRSPPKPRTLPRSPDASLYRVGGTVVMANRGDAHPWTRLIRTERLSHDPGERSA
jgi:hypothetical protein